MFREITRCNAKFHDIYFFSMTPLCFRNGGQVGVFFQNNALIRLTVTEKTGFTDGRQTRDDSSSICCAELKTGCVACFKFEAQPVSSVFYLNNQNFGSGLVV